MSKIVVHYLGLPEAPFIFFSFSDALQFCYYHYFWFTHLSFFLPSSDLKLHSAHYLGSLTFLYLSNTTLVFRYVCVVICVTLCLKNSTGLCLSERNEHNSFCQCELGESMLLLAKKEKEKPSKN